jgi:hypothetical protein
MTVDAAGEISQKSRKYGVRLLQYTTDTPAKN